MILGICFVFLTELMRIWSGFGNLNLSIEGPGRAMIDCRENDVGLCHVRYRPLISGIYAINIRFADEDISGKDTNHYQWLSLF